MLVSRRNVVPQPTAKPALACPNRFPGAAAEYLLSDRSRNVTGTTLYVDSGYHAMGM